MQIFSGQSISSDVVFGPLHFLTPAPPTISAHSPLPPEEEWERFSTAHRQAVLDEFAKIIPTVLKEEGCHGYAPMVDAATSASFQATAPDSIIMVEQWETVAHLEAHLQTAHMKAWSDAVKGDVLETHIRILEQGV